MSSIDYIKMYITFVFYNLCSYVQFYILKKQKEMSEFYHKHNTIKKIVSYYKRLTHNHVLVHTVIVLNQVYYTRGSQSTVST